MNLDRGGKLCMTCSPRALIAGMMSFFTRSAAPRAPRGASTLLPRQATEEALKPPDRLRAPLPMPPREKKDRRGLWGIARQDECFLGSFVSKGILGCTPNFLECEESRPLAIFTHISLPRAVRRRLRVFRSRLAHRSAMMALAPSRLQNMPDCRTVRAGLRRSRSCIRPRPSLRRHRGPEPGTRGSACGNGSFRYSRCIFSPPRTGERRS